MGLADWLGLSDDQDQWLVRTMQLALAGLLAVGLATGRLGMAMNGGVSLAVTLLPAALRREYGYSMDAGLVLWITVAVVIHSAGSLGPYRWFPWYDAIAHAISASVIAGIGYASLRALEVDSEEIDVPGEFRVVFVLVFVVATGVCWEILEFSTGVLAEFTGGRAPLVVMGIDDIVSDLVFNTVGGVVVALWGTEYFRGLARFLHTRLGAGRDGSSGR